jgi:L-fuculose-phosphate aldolase
MDSDQLLHPRDLLMRTMERIYRYRMTTTSGGNLSIREANGDLWITPARVDKGSLTREDIVLVRRDGAIEGRHRPSSELPFHAAIFAARPDLGAIVHAHPVALVAFSICRQMPDPRVLRQTAAICGEPAFAPYAIPGGDQLGRNIAAAFATGANCVVLENHGVVVGGSNLEDAFERFETFEFAAKTIIKASWLGPVRQAEGGGKTGFRQAGELPATNVPPTAAERELRRQVCDFVKRCYQQRLMISTEGAFSARLGQDEFLITPHRRDRSRLDLAQLVRVQEGRCAAGQTASSAAARHRAIYRQHPEIQAIVSAYPVNATAFSITDAAFDSRTIPESWIFLRDVQRLTQQEADDEELLATRLSLSTPAALIANDGVLVCGTSVLDAFDRLEVLETTAEAMINSRPIGTMTPMSDGVIEELRAKFG